jgi:lipopolysaccharide export system protein LptA
MQNSIRILRIVLPILFFGFLILIAASWKHTKITRDKSSTEPVVRLRPEPARVESKEFEDTQTVGGRIVAHIHAKRMVSYSSGWNTLEDVEMTIFRPNGLSYQILCPNAQVNSLSKEADAKGGVRVRSSDGVDIRTAEIHFDGNRLTNHIPVEFIVDRWHGNAGALDLDVPGETLRLFEKVDATMTPEHPDEEPMTLKGREGLFRRKESDVAFTDHVVMTRMDDVLNSDLVTGRFTPDHKQLLDLQGTGHVDIVMAANSPVTSSNAEGRKEITCDRFYSEIGPGGTISAINAVADPGLVHVVIDGPPKRDIVSKTVRVGLNNKIVSDLKAEQQVVMKELGDIPRNLSADHVTIYFDPATRRASTAAIEGNFKYSDPRNTAVAIRANYDIVSDRVLLTAEPGFDPTVTTDGNIVKAKQIEFSPRAQTARAAGEVIAQIISKTLAGSQGSVSADATSIFPSNKPVFVNSDLLMMRQANKTAVFTGNVRAWQDLNTIFAQELQVQGAGDTMTARGSVRTVLYNTNAAGAQAKVPMLSFSDQLTARKSDRRIDLAGNVRIEDDLRTMTSDKASFFFDANRKMDHVEAEQKVVLLERPTGRKGTGDKATYLVNKRLIYVDGSPATVTAPTGNLTGEHILYDLARNKVDVLSPITGTKASYKPAS